MPLSTYLANHAKNRPDQVALAFGETRLTYAHLWDLARRADAFVSAHPRQDRAFDALKDRPVFAMILGNQSAAFPLIAAALAARACMVLIDPSWPEVLINKMLERLNPDLVFGFAQRGDFDGPRYDLQSLEDLEALLPPLVGKTELKVDLASAFMVAFTSGTTSTPKGFARDRASWQRSLERGHSHFELSETSHTLAPGPLVHGLTLYALAETWRAGATFHGLAKFDVDTVHRVLAEEHIERVVAVPSVLQALVTGGCALEGLSQITTAGARLERSLATDVLAKCPGAKLTQYYGASELGFVSSVDVSSNLRLSQGVGWAFPDLALDIRHPDQAGFGEIWVKSDLAIKEYLWCEDTSGFQSQDGWVSVGDIGRLDQDGCLHLLSRAGGMIISGGNNIYPDEVASVMAGLPKIKTTVCLGVADVYLGQRLIAVVEPSDEAISTQEIYDAMREALPRYKLPKDIYRTQEWPLTSSGKIAMHVLTKWITEKDARLVAL